MGGGALAEYSGTSGNIITYNKGASLADIGKKIPSNQTDIRARNDVVSAVALTQNYKNGDLVNLPTPIFQNPVAAHSLENLNFV